MYSSITKPGTGAAIGGGGLAATGSPAGLFAVIALVILLLGIIAIRHAVLNRQKI